MRRGAAVLTIALMFVPALVACGGDDSATPDAAPTGTAMIEVERYAYEIDLETRAASTHLQLHAVTEGNCVALPSRSTALDVGSVTLDESPAAATWDGATLTACMPAGVGFGAGATVSLAANIPLQPLETWGATQVGY